MRSRRRAPVIEPALHAQLRAVPPARDGDVEYRPCAVRLRDGRRAERVYVIEEDTYIRQWGVYPDEDRGKSEVPLSDVMGIEESPFRLPVELATSLYRVGESGMGYYLFGLLLRDGRTIAVVTGDAVDFLPDGLTSGDVAKVVPAPPDGRERNVRGAAYSWCLFRLPDRGGGGTTP